MTRQLTLTATERTAVQALRRDPTIRRTAVQALRRDPTIRPAERDRVEMVLLADGGRSAPRSAGHLACQAATVRGVLQRCGSAGLASLRRRPPRPPPDTTRRTQVETALTVLPEEDRTGTAAPLAGALAERHGIALSTRQTRKYLGRLAAWRRTVRSLPHKPDPAVATHAAPQLARLEVTPRSARFG